MKKILTIILFTYSLLLLAQNTHSIRGNVKDADGNELESVSVRLIRDNVTVRYAISDSLGNFTITKIPSGTYGFEANFLGYVSYKQQITVNKDLQLKPIVLHIDATTLNEVVINATKKVIKPTGKGVILNVSGTGMANKLSVSEILQIAPSVSLHNGLQILGDDHIKVTLNGQDVFIPDGQILAFINNIKPRNIKKIEIIDNSNASFDGEQSAQINIYTKNIVGMNGGVSLTVFNNKYWGYHDEYMLNYQRNRWRYFIYAGTIKNRFEMTDFIEQTIDNDIHHSINQNKLIDKRERHLTTNINYQIDSEKNLSFMYHYSLNNAENIAVHSLDEITTTQVQDSVIKTISNKKDKYSTHTFSLAYAQNLDTLHSNFKINLGLVLPNYELPQTTNQEFYRDQVLQTTARYQNDETYHNLMGGLKIAWDKYFANETELLLGGKLSQVMIDDQINKAYQGGGTPFEQTNKFLFQQDIGAFFINYYFNLKKYRFSTGLRNELTYSFFGKEDVNANKQHYFRLLPNIKISRNLNKNFYSYISFSRKLQRPSFYQFNPETMVYSKTNRYVGNPHLMPIDIYRFQTGLYYKNKYSLNFRYDYQLDNIIEQYQYNEAEGYTLISPINSGKRNKTVIDLTLPFKPYKWWKINNKISGVYADYNSPLFPNMDFSSYYYYIDINNHFKLNRFSMAIDLSYQSKAKYLNTTSDPNFTLNWNLRYANKSNKWLFYVGINDVFNTSRDIYREDYDNMVIRTNHKSLSRMLEFDIVYMFSSGKKPKNNKTEDILREEKNRSKK